MKIILSVEPIRFPLTGIGRYTLELARHLAKLPAIDELRYFTDAGFLAYLPPLEAATAAGPVSALAASKRILTRNPLLLDAHRLMVHRRRRKHLAGKQDYVYHGPNFSLPPIRGAAVVTFHDLSILTMPECHPHERVRYMNKEIELSLKHATMIITDSEYVRCEVARYFSWPVERLCTVHLAGSADFFPRPRAQIEPALHEFDLKPEGYTLYAGTIEPRKNLKKLLAAYEQLSPEIRLHYPLILAGHEGWNNSAIMEQIRRAERQGWARYLGYVPEVFLSQLFAGARLFVFPSRYEGFGLPVLEAMASGIPVVCSSSSSLPEIAGNAAAMCNPEDVDELTRLMAQGLEDQQWRRQAITEGLDQSRKFSWHRCAMETTNVYRTALNLAS